MRACRIAAAVSMASFGLPAATAALKEAGLRVSFTHLIAYAIARAGNDMPEMAHHFEEIDGKPHRVEDGRVNLGLAVDVEKKDGSRTLMVPVISGASALKFEDPRLAMMMAAPPRRADADESHKAFVYLQPQPGTVLMWESWLRHEVPVNTARSERISISFNYGWR